MKFESLKTKSKQDVFLDVDPQTTAEESAATVDAIDVRRAELDEAFEAAAAEHDRACEASDVAAGAAGRLQRAVAVLTTEMAGVNRQHADAREVGIEQTLVGLADRGEIEVTELLEAETLKVRYRVLVDLLETLTGQHLPLAEEAALAATIGETICHAGRLNSLADRRSLETELLLAQVAIEEGDAVLDASKTRTGQLRQHADELTAKAAWLRDQLTARQKARLEAANLKLTQAFTRKF